MCDKEQGIECGKKYPKIYPNGRPRPVEFSQPSEFHREATLEHEQRLAKDRRYAAHVKKLVEERERLFPSRR